LLTSGQGSTKPELAEPGSTGPTVPILAGLPRSGEPASAAATAFAASLPSDCTALASRTSLDIGSSSVGPSSTVRRMAAASSCMG